MAAYMDGVTLEVFGNAQDAVGNTMNKGKIIIHGNAGDTVGYAMRGGEIYIKGHAGYRVGIHMKEFKDAIPVVVIGGKVGAFLGEYMAGGTIILLGLNVCEGEELAGNFLGSGMHGGKMYIRGNVDTHKLGREVSAVPCDDEDNKIIKKYVENYSKYFNIDKDFILNTPFIKLYAANKRPYGNMYVGI